MPDVTRRQFLRNASLGAAAAGVVAAGPATPALEGSDIFAHVVDAKAGQITIFVGTKAISYTNPDLAQQLLRAAQ